MRLCFMKSDLNFWSNGAISDRKRNIREAATLEMTLSDLLPVECKKVGKP